MDRPRRSDCTAGQMDGEAGWWTTSGNTELPSLARVMGVGRQQQQEVQQLLKISAIARTIALEERVMVTTQVSLLDLTVEAGILGDVMRHL